jgi:hypothetical protein
MELQEKVARSLYACEFGGDPWPRDQDSDYRRFVLEGDDSGERIANGFMEMAAAAILTVVSHNLQASIEKYMVATGRVYTQAEPEITPIEPWVEELLA